MLKKDPWKGYIKPSKMVGNLYFVGTKPASTHIIDTGEGLILIDPGYQEIRLSTPRNGNALLQSAGKS